MIRTAWNGHDSLLNNLNINLQLDQFVFERLIMVINEFKQLKH